MQEGKVKVLKEEEHKAVEDNDKRKTKKLLAHINKNRHIKVMPLLEEDLIQEVEVEDFLENVLNVTNMDIDLMSVQKILPQVKGVHTLLKVKRRNTYMNLPLIMMNLKWVNHYW